RRSLRPRPPRRKELPARLAQEHGPTLAGRTWILGVSSRCERQFDPECRAPADLRRKVYRTVMKLYNSERAGKSDTAAPRPRGEKKLEDFLPVLQRNAFPRVAHADLRHFTAAAQHHVELSAVGHGLHGVEH